jgi:hypothetical protein
MNRLFSRRPFALVRAAVCVVLVLPALIQMSPARADGSGRPSTEPRWSVVLSTAPHAPQDVWFTGTGNNADGWRGGGCLCIGPLAQGLGPGDHVTFLIDVVEGGVFGVDGTPVAPGTYLAPGVPPAPDSGPGAELEDVEFEMTPGRTFYVIVNAYTVESNNPFAPVGTMFRSMFTFDFDPDDLGRTENLSVNWFDVGTDEDQFFVPFLNEGVLMTNVRRLP